jgi:hypothetical protein
MSTVFSTRVFFDRRIRIAVPAVLLLFVGLNQQPFRPLHRKAELMKKLAHMSRMVADAKLFPDHTYNHR